MTLPVVYTDKSDRYSTVPAAYDGFQVIQPPSGHGFRDFNLSFDIGANSTIYVAHDNRHGGKPSWLDGTWTDTGDVIEGQDGVTRTVWSKAFTTGTVTLAGNDESLDWTMFIVLVPAAIAITNTVPEYYSWDTLSEAAGGGGPTVQEFHWVPLPGDVGSVPTGWTKRWVDAPWQIAESGGEYYLSLDDLATDRSAISWDTLDNVDNDVQLIFEWEATNASSQFRGLFRGAGLAADETGYVSGAVPVDPTEKINRYKNGATTNLAQTTKTYNLNTRYHTRCEVVGTTLRSKTWVKEADEPGWVVSTTNSEITGTGWFGFFTFHKQGIRIYKLSVATSGGTAAFQLPIDVGKGLLTFKGNSVESEKMLNIGPGTGLFSLIGGEVGLTTNEQTIGPGKGLMTFKGGQIGGQISASVIDWAIIGPATGNWATLGAADGSWSTLSKPVSNWTSITGR